MHHINWYSWYHVNEQKSSSDLRRTAARKPRKTCIVTEAKPSHKSREAASRRVRNDGTMSFTNPAIAPVPAKPLRCILFDRPATLDWVVCVYCTFASQHQLPLNTLLHSYDCNKLCNIILFCMLLSIRISVDQSFILYIWLIETKLLSVAWAYLNLSACPFWK